MKYFKNVTFSKNEMSQKRDIQNMKCFKNVALKKKSFRNGKSQKMKCFGNVTFKTQNVTRSAKRYQMGENMKIDLFTDS